MKRSKILLVSLFLAFAGCKDPVVTTYMTLNYPDAVTGSSTYLTGVRGVEGSDNVYISGILVAPGENVGNSGNGLLYVGSITGSGSWNVLNYPSAPGLTVLSTALYGPNNGDAAGEVQIVGNYTASEVPGSDLGLLYQGPVDGSGDWITLDPSSLEMVNPVVNTIAHSTMGGLVVGNYDTDTVTGKAFIYDIEADTYFQITHTGALSITAYGIWYNGDTSYTIAGGYSEHGSVGLSMGYIADYDSQTQTLSNWTTYTYRDEPTVVTHFEGITTDNEGGYNLVADWIKPGAGEGAVFVNIPRNGDGTFGTATWTDYAYPGAEITSANTVYLNYAIGVYFIGNDPVSGYIANVVP